jgi:hypothetical protein
MLARALPRGPGAGQTGLGSLDGNANDLQVTPRATRGAMAWA